MKTFTDSWFQSHEMTESLANQVKADKEKGKYSTRMEKQVSGKYIVKWRKLH